MKNLKITVKAHDALKAFCKEHFLKMNEWASHVILTEINKLEKKDDKGKKV